MPPFRRSLLAVTVSLCLPAWGDTDMACPVSQPRVALTGAERAARQEANANAPLHVRANSIDAEKGGVTELSGAVEFIRGTERIEADQLRYLQPSDTAEASGNVQFRTGDRNTFYTEGLQLQLSTHLGEAGPSRYTLSDGRGRGDAARIDFLGPDLTRLNKARFTTCREGQDDWFLNVSRLDLDSKDDIGTAYHATVDFFGVPIFYFPYVNFPISNQRKSGFLVPTAGHSDKHGYIVAAPYYFNLAPNYDATMTPRLLTKRGLQLQNEFRYLGTDSTGKLQLEALPSDNLTHSNRLAGSVLHQQTFNPLWAGKIDLRGVSDKDYFQDFGDRLALTGQSVLPEVVETVYRGPSWTFATRLSDNQIIDKSIPPESRPYARLPQVQLSNNELSLPNQWTPQFNGEWNRFDHRSLLTGERFNLYTGLGVPLQNQSGYITPRVGARYIGYRLDREQDDSPALVRGSFSLDSGLFFERDTRWGESDVIQTLEPRLYYLYIPRKNQDGLPIFDSGVTDLTFASLFRENRFSGGDRIGDANQIATAITTRFLDTDEGAERLRLSLGRIYYFSDPQVSLPAGTPNPNQSDFVAEASAWLVGNWHARDTALWNHRDHVVDRNAAYLQYQPARNKIFNMGYVFVRNQIGQYDVSAEWPLFERWGVRVRSLRSTRDDRSLETYAGVEYNACCWALRLYAVRTWQDPIHVNAFMFELQLTGLSKLGGVPESPLKQGLFTFKDGRKDDPVVE